MFRVLTVLRFVIIYDNVLSDDVIVVKSTYLDLMQLFIELSLQTNSVFLLNCASEQYAIDISRNN